MDYVITDPDEKVYIRIGASGTAITCTKKFAQRFDMVKANNILTHLPKTLKKFHFNIKQIQEVSREDEGTSISNIDYVPDENVTRWINKFGTCSDILKEAEEREKELLEQLTVADNEIVDILHIIEIEKSKDLFGGWQLYKRIRNNRHKRRRIKDEMLIIERVLANIKDVSCLHREKVQKAINGLFTRKYTYRVIDEDNI